MSADSREQDLKQRELDLKERELKIRMQELEAELDSQKQIVNDDSEPAPPTTTQELDKNALAQQRKMRQILLFGKLVLLGAGVAVTVIALNFLLFPIIIMSALCALLYGAYVLFLKEKPKPE